MTALVPFAERVRVGFGVTGLRPFVPRRGVEAAGLRLFAGGGGEGAAGLWRFIGRGGELSMGMALSIPPLGADLWLSLAL